MSYATGLKGKTFLVMGIVHLQPEGAVLWQEIDAAETQPLAIKAMEQEVLNRRGVDVQLTPSQRKAELSKYDGPSMIVIERIDRVVYSVGPAQPLTTNPL